MHHAVLARRRPIARALALTTLLTCAISPTADAADGGDRWYASIYGGSSLVGSSSARLSRSGQLDSSGALDSRPGLVTGGAVGLRLHPAWRVELEMTYRSNELKRVSVAGLDRNPVDGDLASLMYMANGYYDFAAWNTSFAAFRPYLGVGVGFAQEIDTDQTIGGSTVEFSGSRAAYQLLAGVNWHYRSRWSAGLGLRYTNAGSVKLDTERSGLGPLRVKYDGLALTAGLGYRF